MIAINMITLFPFSPDFAYIIFPTPGNFTLLRLYIWIPRGAEWPSHDNGKQENTRSANVCVSYNVGDAAYAVRCLAECNDGWRGRERHEQTWAAFLMANSYARVRDFISHLMRLRREPDIVSHAHTVKIRKPIVLISRVYIPAWIRVYISSKISRRLKYTIISRPFESYLPEIQQIINQNEQKWLFLNIYISLSEIQKY